MSKDHSHKHEKHGHHEHEHHDGVPIEIRSEQPAADPSVDPPPEKQALATEKMVSEEQYVRLLAEKDELTATLVRRQADFENFRKRVERERQEDARRGTLRLLKELLPVLDGFERALAAHPAQDDYRKGVELIYKNLWDTLSRQGLERIAAEGKPFDPHYHEAIERVETHEHPDNSVVQVFQHGYLLDGRVLRPSLVRVAAAPEGTGGDASSTEHSRAH
jgi:molecular chaperone GrpE